MNKWHGRDGYGPEPNPESKIWRLTGFGFGVFFFGPVSGFGVNFSDSTHLCWAILFNGTRLLLSFGRKLSYFISLLRSIKKK